MEECGWRKITSIQCSSTWTGEEKSEMSNAHRLFRKNEFDTKTRFRWHNIIMYIWKTPASGDRTRHHLDYTFVQFQGSNRMWNVQKSPRAKIDSEHSLIVADTSTRLKKIIRFLQRKQRWDVQKLCSAKRFSRNTLSSGMRKFKSGIAWKQYQEMCLSDYE